MKKKTKEEKIIGMLEKAEDNMDVLDTKIRLLRRIENFYFIMIVVAIAGLVILALAIDSSDENVGEENDWLENNDLAFDICNNEGKWDYYFYLKDNIDFSSEDWHFIEEYKRTMLDDDCLDRLTEKLEK